MSRARTFSACLVLLASAFAQNSPPISTTQATFPVYSANIQPVTQASTAVVGNPGPQTYFYWLVTKYTLGDSSPIGPFVVSGAPNTLSGSNYVAVTPVYLLGITNVALLRTSSPTPPTGACNCAVATAVTSGTINDQSNSLNAYTVSPASTGNLTLTLTNEVTGTGASHLILRQNGALVQDLSLTGGSGFAAGGDLTGTPSSQTVSGILNKALPSLTTGFLNYNGTNWAFSATPGFTAGGDLSGSSSSQTVSGLLTKALPSLATGFLNYNGSAWVFSTNVPTASALAAVPSICSAGNAPQGVLANGNATGCAPIGGGSSFTAGTDLSGSSTNQTVKGSSATQMYVPAGTSAAPGVFVSNAPNLGLYAATIGNTWTVTGSSSSAGTATLTIGNTSGWPFSWRVGDYFASSAIGGGYDCALSAPCVLTAVNSGASTISYASAGVGNQTSGSVNAFTMGIAAQKFLFQSMHSTSANCANTGSIQLCAPDSVTSHDVSSNQDVALLKKNADPSVAPTAAAQLGDPVWGATTANGAPLYLGGQLNSIRPWNMFSANAGSNFASILNMSGFALGNDGRYWMTDNGLGTTDPWGQVIHPTQPGAAASSYSPGTVDQTIAFSATGIPKFYNLPSSPCTSGLTYTPVANGGPSFSCVGTGTTIVSVGGLYPTLHDAIAACPAVGCIVLDSVTENLTNNSAGNPVQPFCSGTWSATNPYVCTAGTWKFATVILGYGKWTSDYPIIYGTSYEHLLGSSVSVGGAGATTGTLISATASWNQLGPDPGHPIVRLSPVFTGSNYQFNNTIKDLTLDCSAASAAGKVCNGLVNDGADENTIMQNVRVIAAKPPTATSAVQTIARASNVVTVTVTNVQGCNGSTNPCTLQNGQQVILAGTAGLATPANGTFSVRSATPSGGPTTSFTFNQTGPNETGTAATGTVQVAGAFVEWLGNGAQNSKIDELYFLSGSVGYQDANTNGILMSSYSTRGVEGVTMVMGNGTTPNAGVLVTGSSTQPTLKKIHCEGWTHCAQFVDKSGGLLEQLTVGNTSAGDAVNIGADVSAISLFDININTAGTLTLLTDNNFTTPYSPATSVAHMGYYLLGINTGGIHNWWTDLKSFADPQGAISMIEQAAPTTQAITGQTQDTFWGDSTAHRLKMANNGGAADFILGANTTDTENNKTFDINGTGNLFKVSGTTVTTLAWNNTATAHNVGIYEGATTAQTLVAPGATGIPLISQGASSDPAFGTATVPGGGTGLVACGLGNALIGNGTSAFQCSTNFQYNAGGTLKTYGNIATVSNGIPSELATVDLTSQSAAITATNLYLPAATGLFRVSGYLKVTTAATTSSVLGGATGVVITFTDGADSVAQSVTMSETSQAGNTLTVSSGNTGNTTTTVTVLGPTFLNFKTGVQTQYAVGYTSVGGTAMVYEVHLKVEAM